MKNLLFTNCTKIQNKLFFLTTIGGRGLLVKINMDSGEIDCCNIMEGFVFDKTSACMEFLESHQNKLYALDSYGNYLVVFDLDKNRCQYISLNCNNQKWDNFAAFERYGLNYYIFPRYGGRILMFDTEKNKITKLTGCLNCAGRKVQCACRAGNGVWLLPEESSYIYYYDLQNKNEKEYELGRILHDCIHCVFNENFVYILSIYGVVYIWNIKKMALYEITVFETDHVAKESMSRIIYAGNKLILLPEYGNHIKIYDLATGKAKIYDNYPKDFKYQTTWIKYYGYCEDEVYYYFAAMSGNYLLKIEKKTGKLIWVKIEKDLLETKIMKLLKKVGVNLFWENCLEIKDLFRIEVEVDRNSSAGQDYTGKRIYDNLNDIIA